nr:transketolase C-terminal domain-containing protein [Mycobacterium simiae]
MTDAPTPDIQRRLYELMVLMKTADDRLSGGIGTGEFLCVYWPSRGQEAIAAATGIALRPDDQLVTTYRGLHDLIGKGVPLEEIYGEMMGRTVGASRGKGGTKHIAKPQLGVMFSTGIVGAGPPVAVGLALAAKRKQLDRVTVVSFGDGATNTGSFHEAANMAALWDLPMACPRNSAIFDEDPCLFVETIRLQSRKGPVPVNPGFSIPLGLADLKRPGTDVTLIGYGRSVHDALAAADTLAEQGVSAEVVDLRTLVPLDVEAVIESVRRTRRAVIVHDAVQFAGPGAEVAAILSAELFGELAAPSRSSPAHLGRGPRETESAWLTSSFVFLGCRWPSPRPS